MTRTLRIAALLAIGAGAALAAGAGAALAQDAARDKAAANFQQADADGDGALTLSEFTILIDLNAADDLGRARMIKRTGRYQTAFDRIDADGNGRVTVEELAAMAPGS